jgi:rSAM/selenodomain-associated transferase 2
VNPSTDRAAVLSVIVPALNEEDRIGGLLEEIGKRSSCEVVVADGGSSDRTAGLAAERGARVVAAPTGRAAQMNAGAGEATGGILLFLHADTRLPEGFQGMIEKSLDDPAVAGGGFRFALDGEEPFLRLVERGANFRAGKLGIMFGDQGIFVRTALFRKVGGFPDQPIMEDYELVRRARRLGRMVILPAAAVTSARRWSKKGLLRTTLVNMAATWAYRAGLSPERLRVWYDRAMRE